MDRSRANGPRRIELLGLPGAGKTTWVRDAIVGGPLSGAHTREEMEALIARRHATLPGPLRWARVAGWTVRRPRLLSALLEYEGVFDGSARLDGLRQVYRLVRRLHNDTLLARVEPWRSWSTLLLDQGVVQQVWAIAFLRALPPDAAVARILRTLRASLPDEVAWIRTPPATALERMRRRLAARGRSDGDFEERADGLRIEDFERGDRHFKQIAAVLRQLGVAVIEVDFNSLDVRDSSP